jgi:hypothetical protein
MSIIARFALSLDAVDNPWWPWPEPDVQLLGGPQTIEALARDLRLTYRDGVLQLTYEFK